MIKKTEKLVITFHTTTAAMAMERRCKDAHLDGRLIPVPSSISADCGLAWCANPENEDLFTEHMQRWGVEYQEIHRFCI